jgi:hypothetical protein
MKRRSRAGSKLGKARRRNTPMPKRRNAKTVRRRGFSAADQETELTRLARERDEALEQQRATSEVLRAN